MCNPTNTTLMLGKSFRIQECLKMQSGEENYSDLPDISWKIAVRNPHSIVKHYFVETKELTFQSMKKVLHCCFIQLQGLLILSFVISFRCLLHYVDSFLIVDKTKYVCTYTTTIPNGQGTHTSTTVFTIHVCGYKGQFRILDDVGWMAISINTVQLWLGDRPWRNSHLHG